jgi:CO/xanthine dehydrogenase FAD-binding subunit
MSEFVTGPGRSACQPHEILVRLQCDALPEHGVAFEKVGHRRSLVISTVCLAALVKLDWTHRHVADVRVAIGAVGPVPERLDDVEDALTGQPPTPAALRSAAVRVADRVRSRSRQQYRREVLVNFVERGLQAALADAGLVVERLPKELNHV